MCVAPAAAFYAMPQVTLPPGVTDEEYVISLLRATGVLCVYGSGFGARPEDGFFRIVFLASPAELASIYDDIGAFTREFLAGRRHYLMAAVTPYRPPPRRSAAPLDDLDDGAGRRRSSGPLTWSATSCSSST